MISRPLFSLLATFVIGLTPGAFAEEAELYRGPYLQMATPDGITIVWRTEGPTEPIVRFGSESGALEGIAESGDILMSVSADVDADDSVPRLFEAPPELVAERERKGRPQSASTLENTFQYEVRIEGLEPATRYYYAVYDGGRRLAGGETYYFRTLPEYGAKVPTRIWVVGDSGTGGLAQKRVHEAMRTLIAAEDRPLDLYLHVGDMAYTDGTDREFQRAFFQIYDETLRNIVCWPAMGNHEGHTSRGLSGVGPYYDAYVVPTAAEVGGVASGLEAYYSFNVANIHFVCLDSHDLDRSPTGAMAQWLKADLEKADADFLIAFWHHPPYTKGSHDSDREGQLIEMRTHIMPILEAAGVDLVLTGHSHIYERSMLMDGAYGTPTIAKGVIIDDGDGNPDGDGAYRKSEGLNPHEGTVQIVAGHGGAGIRRDGTMPVMREIIVEHGSVIIDVDGDTLVGRMIDKHDEIRDLFSIVKRGKVEVARVEDPWQPEPLPNERSSHFIDFLKDTPGEAPKGFVISAGPQASFDVVREEATRPVHRLAVDNTESDVPAIATYDAFEGDKYRAKLVFKVSEDSRSQAVGLVFGATDSGNYHLIRADVGGGMVEWVTVRDGREFHLQEQPAVMNLGQWHEIGLEVEAGKMKVEIDDKAALEISSDSLGQPGHAGIRVESGTRAMVAALYLDR